MVDMGKRKSGGRDMGKKKIQDFSDSEKKRK